MLSTKRILDFVQAESSPTAPNQWGRWLPVEEIAIDLDLRIEVVIHSLKSLYELGLVALNYAEGHDDPCFASIVCINTISWVKTSE